MTAAFQLEPEFAEYRITVDDLERMIKAGVLDDHRVELIQGKLLETAPPSADHGEATTRLLLALSRYLQDGRPELNLRTVTHATLKVGPTSAPDPDFFVATRKAAGFLYDATEAVLVVEVAYSSLPRDLGVKRSLYARAGIAEYWVVDVSAQTVHVFRDPAFEGYLDHRLLKGEQSLAPLFARSDESVATVAQLF